MLSRSVSEGRLNVTELVTNIVKNFVRTIALNKSEILGAR